MTGDVGGGITVVGAIQRIAPTALEIDNDDFTMVYSFRNTSAGLATTTLYTCVEIVTRAVRKTTE